MSLFCCVRLLPHHSFGGCGCVLEKGVVAVAVLVAAVFFYFGCLVVALEADGLVVVGFAAAEFCFREACGEELGGVFLRPVV